MQNILIISIDLNHYQLYVIINYAVSKVMISDLMNEISYYLISVLIYGNYLILNSDLEIYFVIIISVDNFNFDVKVNFIVDILDRKINVEQNLNR